MFSSLTHDFHLSKTELHYKSDQQALQYTCYLFIDDLEEAIYNTYDMDSLKLFTNNEHSLSDSIISKYLNEHLTISINNTDLNPEYIGKELNDKDPEGMRCYLEVVDLDPFDQIEINNELFLKTFNDQKNLVDVIVDKKSKSFHLLDANDNKLNVKI